MTIAILDDYQDVIRHLACFQLLAPYSTLVIHEAIADEALLASKIDQAEILVLNRTRTSITSSLLDRLPKLKLISQTGKLAGHVDVAACEKRGIEIAEGRGNPISTAELTWTLILNGLRKIPQAIEAMSEGRWQTNIGDRVYGKKIGIWGYGKIGKRIAQYAHVFGAEVCVWGSENSRIQAQNDGFEAAVSKQKFFESIDVLSLHLRLRPETREIVKKEDLNLLKPSALVVNTARAELIEKGALLEVLQQDKIGGAALDVFDEEPIFDPQHPLLQLENVICTPHLGYVERWNYELYFSIAFENCVHFIQKNS